IEINSISVNRGERQRQQLKEEQLEELADSIRALGLIHPIVVTRELVLVSGERRLEACRRLGWTHISAQYTDELEPKRLQLLEYEENIKRVDLTADEQCHALVGFHKLNVHSIQPGTRTKRPMRFTRARVRSRTIFGLPTHMSAVTSRYALRRLCRRSEESSL